MTFTAELILTGYNVEYVDLREPKPRQHRTATAVYTSDTVKAVNTLGGNMTEYITEHFNKGGYYVISIERQPKATATVDLKKLYQGAREGGNGVQNFLNP